MVTKMMKKLMNKIIFSILLFFITTSVFGQQGFTYSYVDPCSRTVKTIFISAGQSVTINYLGFLGTFSQSDFQNGIFDQWVSSVSTQAANAPCDELLTTTQTTQNQIITQNIISTLTSITASASMSTSSLATSVSNSSLQSSSGSQGGRKNKSSTNNKKNTPNNGTNNNSQGNTSNGSTTQGSGSQQGGNTSSGSSTSGGSNQEGGTNNQSGGVSSQGGGQTQQPVTNPSSSNTGNNTPSGTNVGQGGGSNTQSGTNSGSQGQSVPDGTTKQNETSGGGQGGTTNSVSNAASATSGGKGSSRAKVGSIVGTGDIVVLRSNEDGSNQLRGTMSMTKSNTNNTFAKGLLLNFTTNINNTNVTLYGAKTNRAKTNTFIFSNSSMVDFQRNIFNTTTVMDSKRFGKLNLMGGLNFTIGGLAGKPFTNLSAIGGGFVPFTANKKISGNILLLGVYSPFTKFYDGKWWDSGLLIVPFSSWDYTISKSFKYNVSFSGTYELQGSILNYQILTGGKILL